MGGATWGADSRQESEHLHRKVGVGHAHGHLVVGAAVDEDREGVHERQKPLARQSSRERQHVLFGDAHGKEAVGIGVAEGVGLTGTGEIR